MLIIHIINNNHTAFNQKNTNGDYAYPPCMQPIVGREPSVLTLPSAPEGLLNTYSSWKTMANAG